MGSGSWFKAIICRKKGKHGKPKQIKGIPEKSNGSESKSTAADMADVTNGVSSEVSRMIGTPKWDMAAVQIQTAIRTFLARRSLRRQKGIVRLQRLTQKESVKNQSTSTLNHLHSWGRVQAQIKERRLSMVVEGRLKQKKLENQLKLEAKLHDLEVEWCNGSDTMEEILARIHHREEAAVRRERALAYAFTHQWKANNSQNQGVSPSDLGKASWGWSWKERWIAARPWENRAASQPIMSPKKAQSKHTNKGGNSNPLLSPKSLPIKSNFSNGKSPMKARRLSFPVPEAATTEASPRDQDPVASKEQCA